jgi:ParB-like chromosome segregation protein Spo0J
MNSLKIEPKFKELIPPLTPEEYRGLEELILRDGIRDPLATWKGIIVDGHNRFAIARQHGIKSYAIHEMQFPDEDAAMMWIIDNQLGRRNLSKLARIELAMRKEPMIRAKAMENQVRKPNDFVPQKSAEQNYRENETREQLAKQAGVSHDTYRKGEIILETAPPELIQEVLDGKKRINTAYRELQESAAASVDEQPKDDETQEEPDENPDEQEENMKLGIPKNPNYNIEAFQLEFEANAQSYIDIAKMFVTGHYSPLWNNEKYKAIALTALDDVAKALTDLKGLI